MSHRVGQFRHGASRDICAGRPVAVVMPVAACDEAEALTLERLRTEVRIGLEALDPGEFVEADGAHLRAGAEEVKARGR